MLQFKNISYSYGKGHKALADIDAGIDTGICLLLGENGAGKTTLLGLASGSLIAQEGSIDFDGENPADRLPSTMSSVFYLTDDWQSPFRTIRQTAKYHAPFYPTFDADMFEANLAAFGLTGNERLKSLSLGMRHKTGIAYALALRPRLLLLDEPANGLDIDSKKELRRMMSRCIDETQTVIISTHTVADLEVLYDNLLLLHAGTVVLAVPAPTISSRLSFVTSAVPVPDALYIEPDCGVFRAIVRADEPYQTAVDYELLYSAIASGAAPEILNILRL